MPPQRRFSFLLASRYGASRTRHVELMESRFRTHASHVVARSEWKRMETCPRKRRFLIAEKTSRVELSELRLAYGASRVRSDRERKVFTLFQIESIIRRARRPRQAKSRGGVTTSNLDRWLVYRTREKERERERERERQRYLVSR